MTSTIRQLRHKSLFLTCFLLSVFGYENKYVVAQVGEIRNEATADLSDPSGQPQPRVTSNPVTLTAGQALLEIIKTGDRAAAEPGDTVLYRLVITNRGRAPASNIVITDTLPLGLRFQTAGLRGSLSAAGQPPRDVTFTTTNSPGSLRTVTLTPTPPVVLGPGDSLTVVYAAVVTPDAVRGTGRNLAVASSGNLRSNPASHLLRIRPGILSDCATIVGRVFVDKNFDGEQQPGEPGVPNAVVYMDDGNRIVTDANGLFSMANVISGRRTATLDLTSLPGYALAPNRYFIESNSQSRMVRLSPGGMGRLNFAVTPAFKAGDEQR